MMWSLSDDHSFLFDCFDNPCAAGKCITQIRHIYALQNKLSIQCKIVEGFKGLILQIAQDERIPPDYRTILIHGHHREGILKGLEVFVYYQREANKYRDAADVLADELAAIECHLDRRELLNKRWQYTTDHCILFDSVGYGCLTQIRCRDRLSSYVPPELREPATDERIPYDVKDLLTVGMDRDAIRKALDPFVFWQEKIHHG